jgi:hypothetical protein
MSPLAWLGVVPSTQALLALLGLLGLLALLVSAVSISEAVVTARLPSSEVAATGALAPGTAPPFLPGPSVKPRAQWSRSRLASNGGRSFEGRGAHRPTALGSGELPPSRGRLFVRVMAQGEKNVRPAEVERLLLHLEDHRTNGLEALWELKGRMHVQARCLEHVEYIFREHADEPKEDITARVAAALRDARRILSLGDHNRATRQGMHTEAFADRPEVQTRRLS